MGTKEEEERRKEEEKRKEEETKFLDLCGEEGDVESVKALLAEDPSLINCKDWMGKSYMQCNLGILY